MNRATAVVLLAVAAAVGMILLNYGVIYLQPVYNAFAAAPQDLAALRKEKVEATWMFQSSAWTAIFALAMVAVVAYLYWLAKDEFK